MVRPVTAFLLILMFTISCIGPVVAEPPDQTGYSMELGDVDPPFVKGILNPRRETKFGFSSKVTVEKPPVGSVTVSLWVSTTPTWAAVVNPSAIDFEYSETRHFSFVVTVSPYAKAGTIGTIVLTADMKSPSGGDITDTKVATIEIEQYYLVHVEVEPTRSEMSPEKFQFDVRNDGNGDDDFNIDILDRGRLEDKGFKFGMSHVKTGVIAMNHKERVTLKVEYGSLTPWGEQLIDVRFSSIGAEEVNRTADMRVTIIMKVGPLGGGPRENVVLFGGSIVIIVIVIVVAFYLRYRRKKKRRALSKRERKKDR